MAETLLGTNISAGYASCCFDRFQALVDAQRGEADPTWLQEELEVELPQDRPRVGHEVTDFLLIAIRDLLARRPELRIILMSATMQHETFQKYFEGCAEVQIHGRVHPVEAIYLEDLAPKLHKLGYVEHLGPGFAAGGYGYGSWDNKGNEKSFKYQVLVGQTHHPDHLCGYGANAWEPLEGRRKDEGLFLHDVLQQTKGVLYDLPIIEALLDVLQQEPKEVNGRTNGGILIFLPGWDDIDRLLKRLTKVLPRGQFRILPLHSQIRLEQQKEVFQVPPQGVRKIVLSTNIAETAITIDDIDTVIDCGRAKETSYDAFLRVPTLNTSWISKASASQRRGRAGRTKPGVCYHLYCRRRLAMLDEHRPPEMLRSALEDVCLHAKLVMTRTGQQDSLLDFLGSAPDPPEEGAEWRAAAARDRCSHLRGGFGAHGAQVAAQPQRSHSSRGTSLLLAAAASIG